MGDRISIQFQNGEEISPYLFSHWDGRDLLRAVKTYFKKLKADITTARPRGEGPIERLEPGCVMVDFIAWYMKLEMLYHKTELQLEKHKVKPDKNSLRYHTFNTKHISSNYHIETDENLGDNSDNGNFVFDLKTGTFSFEHEFDDI